VDLVRDVLDKIVVDRNGREMGRVDALVLDVEAGRPARVRAIEIGPSVLAGRLHPKLQKIAEAIEDALDVGEGRPIRLGINQVTAVASRVAVDVAIGETGANAVEGLVRALMRGRWK